MKHPKKSNISGRDKRAKRVRKKVTGTSERPRLSVYRSLKSVYAQVVDDEKGVSILGVSSLCDEIKQKHTSGEGGKVAVANAVGQLVAEKAKEKGIIKIVFDRSGYLYHGRVKAVAEGARKGGLDF